MRVRGQKTRRKSASSGAARKRPARRGQSTPQRQDSGRSALDALVAAWPGPAILLAENGTVASASDSAAALLDELVSRTRVSGGLAGLVAAISADGVTRTDTIAVPSRPAPQTFEVVVLPLTGPGQLGALVLARDTSLAANLRHALAESRQRFKDLVEISSDFAWETDASGAFTFVSPQGALGWPADGLLARPAASFIADAAPDAGHATTPFTTRTPVHQVELWLRQPDGTPSCVSVSAVPLLAADGAWRGARGVWRDVTETHTRAQALADTQNRERLVGYITRAIRDEVEPDAMLRAASSAAARALGAVCCRIWDVTADGTLTLAAEFGRPTVDRADTSLASHARRLQGGADTPSPDRDDQLEIAGPMGRFLGGVTRFRHQINGAIGLWRRPEDPPWDEFDCLVMSKIADQIGIAQEQIANHEALSRQASTDALTGLLNRRGFAKQLDQEIADCIRSGRSGTLVYVDLDNFKAVNDRLGHPAGDAALKALAESLRRIVRAGDLVARLGGDEFAMWLAHTGREAAVTRAQAILALKDEIASYSAGPDKPLGLSVGVAVYLPAEPESTAELLARADQAMYEVKRRGKGSYEVAPGAAQSRATRGREASHPEMQT